MLALVCVLCLLTAVGVSGLNVLVFGGTGFVGKRITSLLVERGHKVVSLSRRGGPTDDARITYVQGDAGDLAACLSLGKEHGPFDAAVHCIGVLLDSDSKLSSLNRLASGSGSVPDKDSTYDKVTRITAFNMFEIVSQQQRPQSSKPISFVFVSAAEAAWTFRAPITFLERYLVAKRAVERKLIENRTVIRPTILRPSLIFTPSRPQALISVVPFFVASALRVPFVDRPVTLDTLGRAAVYAIEDERVSGIQDFKGMEELARKSVKA